MQNLAAKSMQNSASDLVLHKSTSSLEKLDENFYGAFQQHYEFLMDKGLIETCQHSGAQKTDSQDLNVNVSYREFMHQFNQIKSWLDQFRCFRHTNKASASFCEKYSNQIVYEEILKRSPRRELLNEYACHLIKYHPNLKHDVLSKLHYLNKQWKSIESIISKRYFNQDMAKDLGEDLKNFQLWLATVEDLLENLSIKPEWTLSEIEHCLNEHKCLQNDIESHAKIINSVLKLSTKLNQEHNENATLYENGMYLQNRWHCLWLKSLEWQCRLEQEINRIKKLYLI
ncbi:nesprin-1 [Brachionus plicatilis]|uniref:Nesprin-1 n=1 Tax=Brachionus plicatilis TaxID=10195 RepID=A0A3M7RP48_BRAPC|nr:nesprin-1 [Brachionus plicatilis]